MLLFLEKKSKKDKFLCHQDIAISSMLNQLNKIPDTQRWGNSGKGQMSNTKSTPTINSETLSLYPKAKFTTYKIF